MYLSIFGVLEYGAIMAGDDDCGLLVTINGSYLNLWVRHSQPGGDVWENTTCRATGLASGLYAIKASKAVEMAEEWLKEILAEGESECG